MKTYLVSSDRAGAVHFGSEEHSFDCLYYPTTFGDCDIKVIVCSYQEYIEEFEKKNQAGRFFGVVGGKFHLYEDDCSTHFLATFEGEYSLYDQGNAYSPTLVMVESFTKGGKIVFEKKTKRR